MQAVLQWAFLYTYLCTGASSAPYNQIPDAAGLLGGPVVKTTIPLQGHEFDPRSGN